MSGDGGIAAWASGVAAMAPGLAHAIFWLDAGASFLVLSLFRRRVVRSLDAKRATGAGEDADRPALQEANLAERMPSVRAWHALGAEAAIRRSHLATLYLLGGLGLACAFALVNTATATGRTSPPYVGFLYAAICFSAPLIVVARVVSGRWNRWLLGVLVAAFFLGAPLSALAGVGNEQTRSAITFAALIALLLHPRLRAMGPLALGAFTVVIVGAVCGGVAVFDLYFDDAREAMQRLIGAGPEEFVHKVLAMIASDDRQQMASLLSPFLTVMLGTFAVGAFVALPLAVVLGALLFVSVANAYASKRTSDQWLVIASVWVFFAFVIAPHDSLPGLAGNMLAVVVFIVAIRVAWPRFAGTERPGVRLLLLRSFSLGERSNRLFQELESLWRGVGSIQLVAGADLAATTLEPHELLAFIRGRSGRYFTHGPAGIDRRIAAFDYGPDPDGRFRVNQIFCVGDPAWQHAVRRLIAAADCLLMDLRGFTKHRAGCVFEIRCLAESLARSRVVFLVDETTDRSFVAEICAEVAGDSSGDKGARAALRFVAEQDAGGAVCERIIDAFSEAPGGAAATP
ncbi:MAG TPA: hypothetical protein VMG60_00485 [Burkholderiaceae bacterium]|nr:hypothetical protein [Burkholderiaceae bacterium]